MKAVILVGGEGTRLRPLTYTTPKPILSLVNIPFIEHAFRMLKRHNVKEVILATGYLPEIFESKFGKGENLGINITYVPEDKPLGTCGAVKNVEEYLDDTFIVINGDVLTGLDLTSLINAHRDKKAVVTISLSWVENPTAYGLVTFDEQGWVKGFLEKPSWDQATTHWINAGAYVLEPEVLDQVPKGRSYSFERGLFLALLEERKPVLSFKSNAYWVDIGNPDKYLAAHYNILYGKVPFKFSGKEVRPGVWVEEGAKIDKDAVLFGPTVIGKNCQIEAGATVSSLCSIGDNCKILADSLVEEGVVLDGCEVGELSIVKESILGQEVKLGRRVRVTEKSVVGDESVISDENHLHRGIKIWPKTELKRRSVRF